MSVQILDFTNYKRGKDGLYSRVVGDLGIKVMARRGLGAAQTEYLYNLYAQETGCTAQALACGTVNIYLENKWRSKPGIWFRHIDGISCATAFETLQLVPRNAMLNQMCDVINKLQALGFSCDDHNENFDNFIYDDNGKVWAIDFSQEKIIDKKVLQHIFEKFSEQLAITIPLEYEKHLCKLGMLELVN